MIKSYYKITKPGIIYGNGLSAIAGFFLASPWPVNLRLFIAMLIGLSLVIASACVFNNIYDREMDSKMERTKNRSLASGKIKPQNAVIFATVLLILGVLSLSLFTNLYSLFAALSGFFVYVFLYTPLKNKTVYATLIGAVGGAAPPVVGYAAVANSIDLGAVIIFFILVFWQMPHFYAIGIRRMGDYKNAGTPILPIKEGIRKTKIHILLYMVLFMLVSVLLTFYKFTGYIYLGVIVLLSLNWLRLGFKGFKAVDDKLWAKKVFLFSLVILLVWCAIIPIDRIIKFYI
jgi:protoheme IX farnesyltransferase